MTGGLYASLPAKGAGKCNPYERLKLVEPEVTVLEGPGSGADEQASWASLSEIIVTSTHLPELATLFVGQSSFELEKTSP
ncbi:MAG TPA: hypothetical protein VK034_13750 [Enhygromyxa sp.]|nr:hypothetical protein [Enhygromyxa sp.]